MKFIVKIFLFLVVMCQASFSFAQETEVEMADVMRSNGKIYIVVAVCLTILIGLFAYVWRVDKKISKLEREGM